MHCCTARETCIYEQPSWDHRIAMMDERHDVLNPGVVNTELHDDAAHAKATVGSQSLSISPA